MPHPDTYPSRIMGTYAFIGEWSHRDKSWTVIVQDESGRQVASATDPDATKATAQMALWIAQESERKAEIELREKERYA